MIESSSKTANLERELFNVKSTALHEVTSMRRFLPTATLVIATAASQSAFAQTTQGPLLIPPSPGESFSYGNSGNAFGPSQSRVGSGDQLAAPPYYLSKPGYHGQPVRNVSPRDVDTAPIRDPEMAQVAEWYRDIFHRPMVALERHNWEIYLHQDTGTLDQVLVQMLGSDEYYKQSGANFDDWLQNIAAVMGIRLSPLEAAQWRDASRGTDRLTFARQFLIAEGVIVGDGQVVFGPRPTVGDYGIYGSQHSQHQHFGEATYAGGTYNAFGSPRGGIVPIQGSYGGGLQTSRNAVPHYLADDAWANSQQHSVGYGPRPAGNSPPDLIAGWYQTYFGRDIAPGELNKWLSDLNKGMPLDEVYASVLAAPEWYNRTGGTPPQWLGSTLAALGQTNDSGSVNYWLDRFRRHNGDRFKTTLEMVRAQNGNGNGNRRGRHFDHDD
jgi:hypothetical protein